jgi:hypothetical protein
MQRLWRFGGKPVTALEHGQPKAQAIEPAAGRRDKVENR